MRFLPAFAAALFVLAACDRPPSADKAREWTPADHDHIEDQMRAAQGTPGGGGGDGDGQQGMATGDGKQAQAMQMIESIWKSQCSVCHGATGKGDGPQGPMLRARDLTLEDWQSNTTDSQIATTIRTGKGKMPKFDMPDPILRGLVERIRFYRGK
jgi:mono/diheme cytochrome c family protein